MNFTRKSRNQKLAEAIVPFFYRLGSENGGDSHALLVAQHLLSLDEKAMGDSQIQRFLELWQSSHPEEKPLSSRELARALTLACDKLSMRMEKGRVASVDVSNSRPKLRLIRGGLSKNPTIPYVDMEQVVHKG